MILKRVVNTPHHENEISVCGVFSCTSRRWSTPPPPWGALPSPTHHAPAYETRYAWSRARQGRGSTSRHMPQTSTPHTSFYARYARTHANCLPLLSLPTRSGFSPIASRVAPAEKRALLAFCAAFAILWAR